MNPGSFESSQLAPQCRTAAIDFGEPATIKGEIVTRILAEEKLRQTNRALEKEQREQRESNIALKALLGRIHDDELELKRNIESNVRARVMPILDQMSRERGAKHKAYAEVLRENLLQIVSPTAGDTSAPCDPPQVPQANPRKARAHKSKKQAGG